MALEACCDNPRPAWSTSREQDRMADVLVCGECGTVHKTESHLVPVIYPSAGRCLNCGGLLEPDTALGDDPTPGAYKCEKCGLPDGGAFDLHVRLAGKVVPGGGLMKAAYAAIDEGRQVLALKLATARIREDANDIEARAVRLQSLEAIGYGESAAREAWKWALEDQAPDVVWSILADLEASTGNIDGAVKALQRGIRRVPNDKQMRVDYSELLLHLDQRQTALDAATHGLEDSKLRARSLSVITEVAERYVRDEHPEQVHTAIDAAADFALEYVPLVYVRAKAAAQMEDVDEAVHWLKRTLELDPSHEGAKQALSRIKPRRKKRWLFW